MKIFNNPSGVLLKRSLDILMRHHRNISENVANLNNPDYKRKPTRFLDELSSAQGRKGLKVTSPRHIRPDPGEKMAPESERGNVSITREMADLALHRSDRSHLEGVNERRRWYSKPWPEAKTLEHPNERVVYDPTHPKADARGFVRMPDVNVVDEMMQMITATRSYEANTSVLTAAKTLARKTLDI